MKDNLFLTTGISLPSVLQAFGDCVAVSDADFNFKAANQGMADLYGLSVEELINKNAFDVYPQFQSSIFYNNTLRTIKEGKSTQKMGYSNNTQRLLMVRTTRVNDDLSAIFTSNINLSTVESYCRTKYDSVTSLKNKNMFEQDLKTLYGDQRSEFGIAFVDIRNFRLFNEQYGTRAGNAVLMEMAERLESTRGVFNRVYRVEADKFAIIIPMQREGCIFEIHRLHALLQKEFMLQDILVPIETAIGFMYVDVFTHTVAYIVEEAEFALSQSKSFFSTNVYHEHILTF